MINTGPEQSLVKTLPPSNQEKLTPLSPVKRSLRILPVFSSKLPEHPFEFPARPQGFSRPESIIPEQVIDDTGGKIKNMAEEFRAIEELVSQEKRHELGVLTENLFKPETEDPAAEMQVIPDPTDKEFVLRTYARMLALKQVTNDGEGARFNREILERREREIYNEYKKRVFPQVIVKRSA